MLRYLKTFTAERSCPEELGEAVVKVGALSFGLSSRYVEKRFSSC
jgi:hypothetical protein